jgi:nicotinate-nucleotide adenylyltransferase
MPRVDVSSTDIRARVAAGKSIRYMVRDEVELYMREQALYLV